jgi:hypothetical protein
MATSYHGCDVYSGGFSYPNATELRWSCNTPNAQPVFSVFFFVSYTLVGSLAMLPMFIGTISLSMSASISSLNRDMAELKQQRTRAAIAKKIEKMKNTGGDKEADHDPESEMTVNQINRSRKLKSVLLTMMEGQDCPFVEVPNKDPLRRLLQKLGRITSDW